MLLSSLRSTASRVPVFSSLRQPGVRAMSTAAVADAVKRKMVRIGTHNGTFHCDEALACYLLKQTPTYKDATIVRTRDPKVLQELDVVVDVGGVYDPSTNRFDHHQREFQDNFSNGFVTRLSSAGLVYKHFGIGIIADLMGLPVDHADVKTVYLAVYKNFMEAIDAIDNGVNQWDAEGPPKYVNTTHLSARVGGLNPKWNEADSEEILYLQFLKAVALTGSEFVESVTYYSKVWLPARTYVLESIAQRHAVDPSGAIMRLTHYCPWKEHLYELEEELGIQGQIVYCLYEDDREKKWRVQAVSASPGSFECRKPLKKEWRGVRDQGLSDLSGIAGCVFVHASGFIGANATYEGALEMARQSLAATE